MLRGTLASSCACHQSMALVLKLMSSVAGALQQSRVGTTSVGFSISEVQPRSRPLAITRLPHHSWDPIIGSSSSQQLKAIELVPAMSSIKGSEREVDPLIPSYGASKTSVVGDRHNPASPEDTAALRRKIDLFILAPLALLYLICYLDRSNLANAKTEISKSLSLSTEQYSLASSLFQVSLRVSAKVCGVWPSFDCFPGRLHRV